MSPAHVDDDAFLTAITVSYVPQHSLHKKYFYSKNLHELPIACYMCFPEVGVAVGLRPGDVLYFNPMYYHCVSGRTKHYTDKKVYVTSFYMKAMQLGLNDNSIGIDNVNCDDDSDDGAVVAANEEVTKIDYGDIPKEIQVMSCIRPDDMLTYEDIEFEKENLELDKEHWDKQCANFSYQDMYNRENIRIEKDDDDVTRFTKRHALMWEYHIQRKRMILSFKAYFQNRSNYIWKHTRILQEYEKLKEETHPAKYEDLEDDDSVNGPPADIISEHDSDTIVESPYVSYDL
jgi:hypothetical protein